MQFAYNSQGQLSRVLDTLGRAYLYHYDAVTGRLIEVDDFTGRFVKYSYDFHGDLLAVTSPAVTGTPNGNDFPNGKTWQYTYSSEFADDRLNHNLLTITAPNEVAADGLPRVIAQYQNNTNSPNLDRLTQLTVEGVNGSGIPAGGTISYQYQNLGSAGSNDFNMAVFQNTVTDRNGNQSQYQFNQLGNIVQLREFSRGLRAGEPAYFQTQHTYNSDGEVLSTVKPLSNSVSFTYDSGNPDRFQQGNLLSEIRIPDSNRGGDQALIQSTMRYEPVYNQLLATTSSQGNDASYVPQNGGTNSQARYTTIFTYDYQEGLDYTNLAAELGITASDAQARLSTVPMGLGDVNGDSQTGQIHGNRIRTARPTVTLLPSSNEAVVEGSTQQPIVSLSIYNQLGQTISERDPEGNVTQYSYNPENNPSGSSQNPTPSVGAGPFGYVHQVTADSVSSAGRDSGANPTAASVATIFGYDAVGNITRSIDGRGIATDYIVNQLNQIVQTTRAAAHGLITNSVSEPIALTDFQYLARTYYDADNNVIRQEVEDRGNTSGTGGFVTTLYEYDILNHEIQMAQEVDANTWLTNQFRYDANGNQTLVIQPVGNATSSVFDERNLLFQRTVGTATPSAGTLGAPVIMSARPGVPSVYTLNYDANGNLIESVDAADKDGSAANNSSIAGAGDVTRTAYDGFDRAKVITDAVGNQTFIIYDPASQAVKSTHRGPLGGASPVNTLGAGNVDLSIVESSYDELGRLFQSDRHLFIPAGVATQRIPNISEGPLTPGDGKVTTRFDYDRNSRQTFIVDDNMNISRQFYDGANRLIKTLDAENNSTESAYDANGNTIEIRSTDVCQEAGITNEIFLTTFFYDSLNRLLRSVDNIGQTVEYRYDSRNNVVAASDASGPPSGSIARRAFNGGALTVNTINGFGNVTLSSFDGLNRKIRQDSVMTASGKGDGTNIGADIFGIKTTTPAPDLSQAGGDGLITVRYLYDNNSLLTSLTDDNGNQTQYTYDNHNRRLTETKGICVAPNLANRCETPTTISLKYDTDGDTTQIVDENGSIVTNRFDAIHRLITRVVARATNVIGTTEATFQYDGLSRPVLGTDNNDPLDTSDDSAVTYAYDSFGRVIEETQQIGSSPAMAVSSSWEAANHRSSLIYPNGRAVTNTFDHLNRIQSIGDVGTTIPVASYSFIGKARVAERQTPLNNTKLTYLDNAGLNDVGYDGLRRTVQLTHFQGTNILTGFAHTYDRRNNPLSETKLHATNDSELYQFDSEDRLFEFSKGTLNSNGTFITTPSLHAALQTNWTFDGVGNWERVNNETRQHNSFNEIIQRSNTLGVATIVSDKNGSETDNGTLTFQCDYKNRLRKVSRKSDGMLLATYAYDTSNRRISKTVTNSGALNGVTRYYSSGGQELEERDGTNGLMQQYVYGRYIDEPLVLDRNLNGDSTANGTGDQRLFYQANRQHSISALTDTTGNVVEGYEYDAYGTRTVFSPGANGKVDFGGDDNVTSAGVSLLGNAIGFTGRRLDAETGLYYYRNRYLSPIEGRFISRDPAGYGGGDLNLQAYVGGRALSSLDPSGLGPIEDVVNWCLTHPDECNAVDKVKEIWDETDKFREYLDEREAQWERDVGNEVVNTLNEAVHVWNQSAIDHRPTYQQHVEAVSFANEPLVFYPREILNASADSRSRDLVELAATQKREQAQAAAQQAQALEDKAVQIMDNAIGIVEGAVKQCNDIDALKRGTAQDFANILEAMADKMLTVVNSATEAYNAAKNGDVSSANAFIKQGNTSLNDMQNLSTDISVDIYHLEEEGLINGVNFRSNGNTSNPNNSNSSTGTPVPSNPGVGDPGGWLTGPSGNCDTCE
jgi:RHS repeat-associated protein